MDEEASLRAYAGTQSPSNLQQYVADRKGANSEAKAADSISGSLGGVQAARARALHILVEAEGECEVRRITPNLNAKLLHVGKRSREPGAS